MKRKIVTLGLATVMAIGCLAGCGKAEATAKKDTAKKDTKTEQSADGRVDLLSLKATDYMKDIDYDGAIDASSIKDPTEDEIHETISGYLEYYKTYKHVDGEVTADSLVNISYVGTIGDYAFEGGSAENQTISIKDSGYIEGFAEGLVGHKAGDKVTLNLKFPEDYGQTTQDADGKDVFTPYTYTDKDGKEVELPGKDVKFEVTINYVCGEQITKFEDLDDQAVSDMTSGYYNTVDELVSGEIDYAKENAKSEALKTMWDNLVKKFEVKKGSEDKLQKIYDKEEEYVKSYYESLATSQGAENGMALLGYTDKDEYNKYLKDEAEYEVKRGLIVNYIATKEKLLLSDEKLEKKKESLAKEQGFENFEEFAKTYDTSDTVEYIYYQIVGDFLLKANGVK